MQRIRKCSEIDSTKIDQFFLFRIEKKNNLQVRLNFYQIVKFESRFHQLCNMNGVEQRRLLSTKHVCCQGDKNRRGKNAFTINLLAIFLYRSLKYQNNTLCSPHRMVIVFHSMNTIEFRALRYKLFFVKALTKRLRKLTIITKRL